MQTEKARHVLAVNGKVKVTDLKKTKELRGDATHSKPDKEQNNRKLLLADLQMKNEADGVIVEVEGIEDEQEMTSEQRQLQLMAKCLKLLRQKHFLEMAADARNSQVGVTNQMYPPTL